jgi:hypothetical protein
MIGGGLIREILVTVVSGFKGRALQIGCLCLEC